MTYRTRKARTIPPMLALLAAAAAIVAVLLATRPVPAHAPASWTGNDLAVAILWFGAVIATVWLAVTTLACVAAIARGRTRSAHHIARFAPPLARRVLQAALISSWALVPTAAYATPSSAPIIVHADARGRLTTEPRRAAPTPVHTPTTVPTPISTSTTTAPSATTPVVHRESPSPAVAPIKPSPSPAGAPIKPSPTPLPAPAPVGPTAGARIHVVVAGDNLWQIARTEVARASGSERVSDAQVAPYWQRVIAANQATLRSGNPSLIFPGEVIALP